MRPQYIQLAFGEKPPRVGRIERTCPICGITFFVEPCRLKHGRGRTCSPRCQYESNKLKAASRFYPTTSPRVEITCAVCGKTFEMRRSEYEYRSKTHVPQYCSSQCAHQSPEWKQHLGDSLRTSPKAQEARARVLVKLHEIVRSPEGRARSRTNVAKQMTDPESRERWLAGVRRRSQTEEWKSAPHFQKGALHPRYTGSDRKERTAEMSRYEYKAWRTAVMRRDNYTCADCNVRGGRLVAHHVEPWASNPELRYEVANGITLCESCHDARHGWSRRTKTSKCVDCGERKPRNISPRCIACWRIFQHSHARH